VFELELVDESLSRVRAPPTGGAGRMGCAPCATVHIASRAPRRARLCAMTRASLWYYGRDDEKIGARARAKASARAIAREGKVRSGVEASASAALYRAWLAARRIVVPGYLRARGNDGKESEGTSGKGTRGEETRARVGEAVVACARKWRRRAAKNGADADGEPKRGG